jgi:hypothetical protein
MSSENGLAKFLTFLNAEVPNSFSPRYELLYLGMKLGTLCRTKVYTYTKPFPLSTFELTFQDLRAILNFTPGPQG